MNDRSSQNPKSVSHADDVELPLSPRQNPSNQYEVNRDPDSSRGNILNAAPSFSKTPKKKKSTSSNIRRDRFALQAMNGDIMGDAGLGAVNAMGFTDSITRAAKKMGGGFSSTSKLLINNYVQSSTCTSKTPSTHSS